MSDHDAIVLGGGGRPRALRSATFDIDGEQQFES
jgi:hypothetical protein